MAEPVGPDEPEPSLEDTVTNLENLVTFLREQLRLANEENHRRYQQLQELLQEHERLNEQYQAARTVAGNFYMDRQWTLHQAEQQGAQQDNEIQNVIDQRINQLLNRQVYFTLSGECWHLAETCVRGRTHGRVLARRACRVCVHALQLRQTEDTA